MPRKCTIAAALIFTLLAPALAQNPPATAPAPAHAPGSPGFPPDPVKVREFIMSRFKTAIGSTDEEWKLIEPRLAKIILLQLDATGFGNILNRSRGGAPGNRGGFNVSTFIRTVLDPDAPPSAVEEKTQELQELIDNNETSSDFYKTRLANLRKAREKARQDLDAAEKDLTTLLTIRQEATLVQMGILD